MLSELAAMAMECAEPGWDGGAAVPLDSVALLCAERFVLVLLDGISRPEFAPEPDGSISLDWIRSRDCMVSLSIGPSDRLAYAWLNGPERGHEVARFDGQNVPARILDAIMGRSGLL